MAVQLAATRNLPRANVRDRDDPFPRDQYVKVSNVAIFSEHETKTPEGEPQRFDQDALQRLIDRGNERIEASGDYAAVCVGHTHDPDDPNGAEEQPEVIGAMGPYRLGLLGHPGRQQKYAILADLWIRRDKIDKYNAHPRRSVELWYEHDRPAWIDPLSLLTEAPRLDLGLTPLIPTGVGTDGAELKYLYSASRGGLRRVKYAAAAPAAGNVFVPAETGTPNKYALPLLAAAAPALISAGAAAAPALISAGANALGSMGSKAEKEDYSAGDSGEPASDPHNPQTTKENLMLAPEDIRQICDAIEQLDVMVAMRDFMPLIPKLTEMMAAEDAEHAAMNEVPGAEGIPGEVPPETGLPGASSPAEPAPGAAPPEPAGAMPPPEGAPPMGEETPPEALPEDLEKVKHSADAGTTGKNKEEKNKDVKLDDMSDADIERYLCDRKAKAKYAVAEGTAGGKTSTAPAEGTADPGKAAPGEGSVAGETPNAAAKYSMAEMATKLAALEADKVARTDEVRKEKLRTLRYHRAFDLDKEFTRTTYSKMSDEAFREHLQFIVDCASPTCANSPLPVPDELLDSAQPSPSVRQGPEKYSKEKCDEAVRICYDRQQAGTSISYEAVLTALVNGQTVPE